MFGNSQEVGCHLPSAEFKDGEDEYARNPVHLQLFGRDMIVGKCTFFPATQAFASSIDGSCAILRILAI